MKRLSIKIAFCFLSFCVFAFSAQAQQQFKWVTGGGTTEDFSSGPSDEWEHTEYMCTDANGNVYALSQVGNDPIYADTFIRLSGAYGADNNILLTSYNCNGQMRWAKLITDDDLGAFPLDIKADNLGNIYVSGTFKANGSTLYIGYDTVLSGLTIGHLSVGLIQFDTSGHFKWIRYVGPNTFASESLILPIVTTAIDGINDLHYFCYMETGVPIMPGVTSIYGVYDMTYNPAGTLLSSVRLDMDSMWYLNGAVIDPVTNKLYVSGEINQGATGGFLTDTFYAAAFDVSRHLLWQYFCGHGDDDGVTGVVMDESKHLYFCGAAGPYSGITTFSFHGDSVSAPFDVLAIIMKTDTSGNVDWFTQYGSHTSVNGFNSITLLPNNKVAVVGTFAGTVTDGTASLSTLPGYGWSPYIAVVDSESNLLTLLQAYGNGFYNEGLAITSDKVGNIYIGGEVADSIFGGTIPAYHTYGGNTDFFVMKYGVDCSCTNGPTAAYTDTGTHHTIGVTYTGTTSGLDSVVWSYGDGTTSTGTTGTHTYAAAGTYEVCVTTYTDCGVDEHCGSFVVDSATHVSVTNLAGGDIRVFPNPARDELNVSELNGNTAYQLFSVTGVSLQKGMLQQGGGIISMQGFSAGVYILELVGISGERDVVRVVKE